MPVGVPALGATLCFSAYASSTTFSRCGRLDDRSVTVPAGDGTLSAGLVPRAGAARSTIERAEVLLRR